MTSEAEKALVIIYAEYLRRRNYGTDKKLAVKFPNAKLKAIDAFSSWDPSDIDSCLSELKSLEYIGKDILGNVTLLNRGISYLQDKPREFFAKFAGFISDLLALIAAFASA